MATMRVQVPAGAFPGMVRRGLLKYTTYYTT